MSAHQCPECVLRYATKTEMEWHLREEHPDFRHDYPEHPHPHEGGSVNISRTASPWSRLSNAPRDLLSYLRR